MTDLGTTLKRLYALAVTGPKLDLSRLETACEHFSHPERGFEAVHVSGTNGKGTVCAFVASMARATGKKVGLYTSPHLVRFAERIQIDGEPIDDETLVRLLNQVMDEAPELTFFEVTTLTAFLAFREAKIDLAVIETGLGGRLDATNIIPPPRIAAITSALLVATLTVLLLNGVVAKYSMRVMNSSFAALNDETTAESEPTTSPLRSGGPGSLVTWDSIGLQGRVFIGTGPTVADLERFNGAPAKEPVRSYVGLGSEGDPRENAKLAVAEMERSGAFSRKIIAVAGTTGTGWINRSTVDSLEYMYNGDTATVAIQYSYLPSWLSFLVDNERCRRAGQALFEAVSARVRKIPEAQRPKLVVFGESLGTSGAEAPFGTIPDIAARTDGAFFAGPIVNNPVWKATLRDRDKVLVTAD